MKNLNIEKINGDFRFVFNRVFMYRLLKFYILLGKRLVYCTYNNEEMRINCSAHLNFQ